MYNQILEDVQNIKFRPTCKPMMITIYRPIWCVILGLLSRGPTFEKTAAADLIILMLGQYEKLIQFYTCRQTRYNVFETLGHRCKP